jgi:Putative transposase/Transposase zinc-binding domain
MAAVADICRSHGPDDREQDGAQRLPRHLQAREAIDPCRTDALGGHIDDWEPCQAHHSSDRSGTNRHGPKGQPNQAQAWLPTPQAWRLPVPHCMVTFTLPAALRGLARSHQQSLYTLLLRRSAAALQALTWEPSLLGGHRGLVGVLHTWLRDLPSHPPVHSLVPGGGLSADGQDWLPSREACLGHVTPLSRRFRAKFREH